LNENFEINNFINKFKEFLPKKIFVDVPDFVNVELKISFKFYNLARVICFGKALH